MDTVPVSEMVLSNKSFKTYVELVINESEYISLPGIFFINGPMVNDVVSENVVLP